jgi:PTH1 family peptidyl-tRNA hydrolase
LLKPLFKVSSSLKERTAQPLWLILGLGNVGSQYERSRHNFGFLAAERFSEKFSGGKWKSKWNYYYSVVSGFGIICAKPKTMMNLSGIAAKQILERFDLPPERMIVIYDDMDITFGKIRVRSRGGYGGHKGILSICSVLNTENFPRIRLGIQNNEEKDDAVEFVLGDFTVEEQSRLDVILDGACNAAFLIAEGKMEQAMNKYN